MDRVNHLFRYTNNIQNHFQKHGKKYLFGTLWIFAIMKMALLFVWFFGTLNLGKSFAQGGEGADPPLTSPVVLDQKNVVSMGCRTDATSCDLSNTWITSIENDTFVHHTQLQILDLSQNQLEYISWVIFPSSLIDVNLSNNQLRNIDWAEFPSSLQRLSLWSNQLKSLYWTHFPHSLQELNLDSNQLANLDWVEFPGSLGFLSLSNNQITNLSGAMFPNSLITLRLDFNQITNLSGIVFSDSLKTLNLSNNEISIIWENIMNLTELYDNGWLNINNNYIDYTQLSPGLLAFIDQKSSTGRRETQTFTPLSPPGWWESSTTLMVTLVVVWWDSACYFSSYPAMEATTSIGGIELRSDPASYYCAINGGSGSYVTVQSSPLINLGHQIPASNVNMRQVLTGGLSSNYTGSLPPGAWEELPSEEQKCSLSTQLGTTYTNIASGATLLSTNDLRACWYWNETQLKIIVPPNTPAGTYSGDIVFIVYDAPQ